MASSVKQQMLAGSNLLEHVSIEYPVRFACLNSLERSEYFSDLRVRSAYSAKSFVGSAYFEKLLERFSKWTETTARPRKYSQILAEAVLEMARRAVKEERLTRVEFASWNRLWTREHHKLR